MRLLACVLASLAACSSSSGGAVSGTPPGGGFELADSISASVTTSDGAGGSSSSARIVLASTSGLCGDATASPPVARKLQRYITIDLSDVTAGVSSTPTAPGTYTIYPNTGSVPPKEALLETGGLDATCQSVDEDAASAQSGSVTLTTITGGAFSGTFDVTLNTGEHLTGSFDPEPCAQLATATDAQQTCR
jgi:hypothetical protein